MNRTATGMSGLTGLPTVDAHLIHLADLRETARRGGMPRAARGAAQRGRAERRLRRLLAVRLRPALPSM